MLTVGLLFWIIMIIILVFGFWRFQSDPGWPYNNFPWYVLFFLVGWKLFGWPVSG
jgi:hypothetical protein